METTNQIIGKLIKHLRSELNINQKELADILGVGQANISLIEKGKYTLKVEQMLMIAEKLQLSPNIIMTMIVDVLSGHNLNLMDIGSYDQISKITQKNIIDRRRDNLSDDLKKISSIE